MMQKMSKPFLISMAIILFIYFTVAILLDPRGYFRTGLFPRVILDARLEKQDLFNNYIKGHSLDGIILGSSRSMKISPKELKLKTNLDFFNFAVDSARVEDYLAIYRWARSRNNNLKYLLIGVDVEAFHNDNQFDVRLLKNQDLLNLVENRQDHNILTYAQKYKKYFIELKDVTNRIYVQEMVKSMQAKSNNKRPLVIFAPDGFQQDKHYLHQKEGEPFDLEAKIKESKTEYQQRFNGMSDLSSMRKDRFRQLIEEARADHVYVFIWISPIHPELTKYLTKTTRYIELFQLVDNYLNNVCHEYNVPTYDFGGPTSFGGSLNNWMDGAHVDDTNGAVLTRKVAMEMVAHGL